MSCRSSKRVTETERLSSCKTETGTEQVTVAQEQEGWWTLEERDTVVTVRGGDTVVTIRGRRIDAQRRDESKTTATREERREEQKEETVDRQIEEERQRGRQEGDVGLVSFVLGAVVCLFFFLKSRLTRKN